MSNQLWDTRIPTYDDLIIEGNSFSSYGVYVASENGVEMQVLPSKTVNTKGILGMEGTSFLSSSYDAREFKLPFFIEDLQQLDSFKMLLVNPYPYWLEFVNASVKLKVVVKSDFVVKPYGNKGLFTLEFIALDPFFYEVTPISRQYADPTIIDLFNEGNYSSSPIYKLTGQGTINLTVNGEVMTVRLKETPETLIINCKTFETYTEPKTNRVYDNLSYTFPQLKAGNNTIQVEGNCTLLEIQPNSKWI